MIRFVTQNTPLPELERRLVYTMLRPVMALCRRFSLPLDVLELYTFYGALEFNHGTMRTRLSLVHGLRFLTGRVPFPLPSLEMYWRF